MEIIQPVKKTDIPKTFEKLQVGQTTYIPFRDSSPNNVCKAKVNYIAKNKKTVFDVTYKDQTDRTLITRLKDLV